MNYDIALLEKEGISGLKRDDIILLYGLVGDLFSNSTTEVYPIELEARENECSAMGFLTKRAAETLEYEYEASGLHDYIASILDGKKKPNKNNCYRFKGLKIYLTDTPLR